MDHPSKRVDLHCRLINGGQRASGRQEINLKLVIWFRNIKQHRTLCNPLWCREPYIGISRGCFLADGSMKSVKSSLVLIVYSLAEGVIALGQHMIF